ncbi:MAG TPA: STAS domain-containing protein [Acidimicrobiales bacterium]|nr:STAS domain-containing protein [Acidimicrobiales bacterium]
MVRLSGDLDIAAVGELSERLGELVALGDDVVVDLGGLTFIDSTGMGALVWARNRCQRHGRDIVLRNPQRAVAKTLSLTGLDQVFVIEHEGPGEDGPGAA